MVVLLEALNRIRDLVYDDVDKGQLGTGTTSATENDTALETPDADTLLAIDSITKGTKSLKIDYLLPSTGGNTAVYTEFEFLMSGAATVDYDRIVFTGFSFTPNGGEDFIISKIYTFRGI